MSCTTWLLSRVTEKDEPDSCCVQAEQLYETFKLESIEEGLVNVVSKREFSQHVQQLFNVENMSKWSRKDKTAQAYYKGIILKPLEALNKCNSTDLKEIHKFKPPKWATSSTDMTEVVFVCNTIYTSNGHDIKKILTFKNDLTWSVSIGETDIDLPSLGIDVKFYIESEKLKTIFKTVEKIRLCYGMELTKSTVCSRYHTLETWKNCETNHSCKRIRTIMCLKVVKVNSRTDVCLKCQRMTFGTYIKPVPVTNKENNVTVTRDLLKRSIPSASDAMIELLISQFENVEKHPKGRRWTKEIINVCLQLYTRSPAGYATLKSSNVLVLPSPQLLVLYKSYVQHRIGFHDDIFRWMHAEARRMEISISGWKGGVILDEMAIQQDLQIHKNGDVELCGIVDVGEEGNTCNILRMGKKELTLGTHVLQFIFLGLTGFRFPFGHFITNNVAAYDIHTLFWDAVVALSLYGFTTLYTSMDGAQSNRTFLNINLGKDSETMTGNCPECPENSVVFMMDISHVVKKIRNNVIKSGLNKACTRNLMLPDDSIIQWQMWVDAFSWDQKNGLRLHRKLTNEHICPSSQSKMRNHLADEALNGDMLHLMCQYQDSLANKGVILNGAILFLRKTAKMIEIFHEARPVRTLDDTRIQDLTDINSWFTEWTNGILCQDIRSVEKSKKLISAQCREDIRSCLVGFCELCKKVLTSDANAYVTPSLINSDIVENHFCQQRATYNGANSNPTALQYRNNQNAIILGQNVVSTKANAGKSSHKHMTQSYKFHENSEKKRKKTPREDSECSFKKIKVLRM